MTWRVFAVERYEPAGYLPDAESATRLTTARTRLLAAVHLPADDAVLAFVAAADEETVIAAADAAGWRVDRLGPAVWVTSLPEIGRDVCDD